MKSGGWFHRMGQRLSGGLQRFMMGRYGGDKLNMLILTVGAIACIAALFIWYAPVKLGLMILSYVLMGWSIFRSLSRNTYKRYQENRRYLLFLQRLKDRDHKYYSCPKCRQNIRVPKGKGKIAISCPKCKEKFVRKT